MAQIQDYGVLLMTSIPETIGTITTMTREHFPNVESVYWEMGNKDTKRAAYEEIEASDYNLIISYINGIILNPNHLAQASFGAVNIHPAPPEHPGLWGQWCQPVIRRDIRTHHGVTLHEIDQEIDHGLLAFTLKKLAASTNGSKCFTQINEQWDASNAHHSVADVQAWFRDLDPDHPAHGERVFFNHPDMMAPPYFTDLVE